MEFWLVLVGSVALGLLVLFWWARWLARREPYLTFLRLPVRRKIALFRAVVTNPRVPWWVKGAPFLLAAYLVSPFDLVPDFIPVLGYLDDVALALVALVVVLRFTPSDVIGDLLDLSSSSSTSLDG